MKNIYIILSYTGTVLSKIIKSYTNAEFTHISIALDKALKKMYSFGRLNPYTPLWAGFVHERINRGTFKRFHKTQAKIYELCVTDTQYEKMQAVIKQFNLNKKDYKFNITGLFAAGFQKKLGGENSFYCAEFVKYVLEEAGIDLPLPAIVKPEDFKDLPQLNEIYSGLLRKYKYPKTNKQKTATVRK